MTLYIHILDIWTQGLHRDITVDIGCIRTNNRKLHCIIVQIAHLYLLIIRRCDCEVIICLSVGIIEAHGIITGIICALTADKLRTSYAVADRQLDIVLADH